MKVKLKGTVIATFSKPMKKGNPVPHVVIDDGEDIVPVRCWKRGISEGITQGMTVSATVRFKGREWNGQYFLDCEAESIDFAKGATPHEVGTPPSGPPADDDIPF